MQNRPIDRKGGLRPTLPDSQSINFARVGITGGILAGGEGRRLGGVDKGLVHWRGRALVQHALDALRPQTERQLISANQNVDAYAFFGAAVVKDVEGRGPLAGLAALLAVLETEWLLCVPCDAPLLPPDLAARLLAATQESYTLASLLHDGHRGHPTFCLVHHSLAASARTSAARSLGLGIWLSDQRAATLNSSAPVNLNTPEDFLMLDLSCKDAGRR